MSHPPSFYNYGQYSSNNYGVHSLVFTFGSLRVWFSYQTPVAFESPKTGFVISKNYWGPTTGKHLNWINSDKSKRIPREDFERQLSALTEEKE